MSSFSKEKKYIFQTWQSEQFYIFFYWTLWNAQNARIRVPKEKRISFYYPLIYTVELVCAFSSSLRISHAFPYVLCILLKINGHSGCLCWDKKRSNKKPINKTFRTSEDGVFVCLRACVRVFVCVLTFITILIWNSFKCQVMRLR